MSGAALVLTFVVAGCATTCAPPLVPRTRWETRRVSVNQGRQVVTIDRTFRFDECVPPTTRE